MSSVKTLSNSFNKNALMANEALNKSKELFLSVLRSITKQIMFEKYSFQTIINKRIK